MLVEHSDRTGTETLLDTDNPFPNGLPENASAEDEYVFWSYACIDLRRRINRMRRSSQRQELKNLLDHAMMKMNRAIHRIPKIVGKL